MKRIFRTTVLGAGALAAGLFTASLPANAADEIIIGLSYGRTGIYSTINKTTEVAVDIAVEEINAAGGINGKQVRIVKFDTAGDPKQAVVAVRKFAKDDNALAVIGPFSSSEARVAFAAGEREKITPPLRRIWQTSSRMLSG
jgi:branched-chain amino acid transport system substrate-binding protein